MSNIIKGAILAGGKGTRLGECTKVTNKHLLAVYNQPMIYYPLFTLINAGIKEIIIITGNEHAGDFIELLGDGSQFGVEITYRTQREAGGIAEALKLCKNFVNNGPLAVILGDNVFKHNFKESIKTFSKNPTSAKVFLKSVENPKAFGVAKILDDKIERIDEKPKKPKTNLAVTGFYLYSSLVWDMINDLKKSDRGELEISDINNWYIKYGLLEHEIIEDFWSDCGTPDSLLKTAEWVRTNL